MRCTAEHLASLITGSTYRVHLTHAHFLPHLTRSSPQYLQQTFVNTSRKGRTHVIHHVLRPIPIQAALTPNLVLRPNVAGLCSDVSRIYSNVTGTGKTLSDLEWMQPKSINIAVIVHERWNRHRYVNFLWLAHILHSKSHKLQHFYFQNIC